MFNCQGTQGKDPIQTLSFVHLFRLIYFLSLS